MAHYKVIIAYDGTGFLGFQRQKTIRTVQFVFENALRSLGWKQRAIYAAGRTDTGVHASGQVVSFELDWKHTPIELCAALNAHLPADLVVKQVSETTCDFHPRYDAISRTYLYHLYYSEVRNPLRDRYAWRIWPTLELSLMDQAAAMLIGVHDFYAFGTPNRPGGSTVRKVYHASWYKEESGLCFKICANGFLYHMVRRLVYTQVLVGNIKLDLEDFHAGIENAKIQPPGMAPSQGLVLDEVTYGLPGSFGSRLEND